MNNEAFLNYAYVATGLATVLLALIAWQWLRRPLGKALATLSHTKQSRIVLGSLPTTFVLAAIATFFANVPGGCGHIQAVDVASDRTHALRMLTEAFQKVCSVVVVFVFVWCLILVPTLLAARQAQASTNTSGETNSTAS